MARRRVNMHWLCSACDGRLRIEDEGPFAGYGVRRTRRCAAGHELTTYELPASVMDGLGRGRVRAAMGRFARGERARRVALDRRAEAAKLFALGARPADVAHALDITEARARQLRSALKQEQTS